MMRSGKTRLRRTMMFLSAQRPGMLQDAYLYGPDSVILDLEDAVAENQKDAARFTLYGALKALDYGAVERIVRINGLDTPHWREDIRVCVAGGADGVRIAKCESAGDVHAVERCVEAAEREFHRAAGETLLMAAIESPLGVLNAYEIAKASDRLFGIALSGGDLRRFMHTAYCADGKELLAARGQMMLAARAAGVQCFDTVFTDLDDMEGFRREVQLIKELGFDGKSVVNPRQIPIVHEVYAPTEKEVRQAMRIVRAVEENREKGIGVFTLDGKMIDIAFYEGARRVVALAKASGVKGAAEQE